jgi:hypothetical protein
MIEMTRSAGQALVLDERTSGNCSTALFGIWPNSIYKRNIVSFWMVQIWECHGLLLNEKNARHFNFSILIDVAHLIFSFRQSFLSTADELLTSISVWSVKALKFTVGILHGYFLSFEGFLRNVWGNSVFDTFFYKSYSDHGNFDSANQVLEMF